MADEATVPDAQTAKKAKPTKPLPTYRIAFQKQIDVLRAYAVAYEATNKAVSALEVASIVKMAATTLPHANSFFGDPDIGLLQKVSDGYIPSQAVIAFNRAFAWNADTAAHKLAPAFQGMWFGQALMPRLAFRAMEEREAIHILAEASGATPDYEPQLALLLAYLETVGLIEREGGQVRISRSAPSTATPVGLSPPQELLPAPATRGVETAFMRPSSGDGVHFNVSIDVDMKEMGTWEPARITAFFAGFAQVLAAKGALEKNAAKE